MSLNKWQMDDFYFVIQIVINLVITDICNCVCRIYILLILFFFCAFSFVFLFFYFLFC